MFWFTQAPTDDFITLMVLREESIREKLELTPDEYKVMKDTMLYKYLIEGPSEEMVSDGRTLSIVQATPRLIRGAFIVFPF